MKPSAFTSRSVKRKEIMTSHKQTSRVLISATYSSGQVTYWRSKSSHVYSAAQLFPIAWYVQTQPLAKCVTRAISNQRSMMIRVYKTWSASKVTAVLKAMERRA